MDDRLIERSDPMRPVRAWAREAARHPAGTAAGDRARVHLATARFLRTGESARAGRVWRSALATAQVERDLELEATCLLRLAMLHHLLGDFVDSRRCLDRAAGVFRDLGHTSPEEPLHLVGRGVLAALDGDYEPAVFAGDVGNARDGWLQEQIVLPASALVKLPGEMSYEDAAALGAAAITAWAVLEPFGRMQAGDVVLTLGTGGVAILALQLAKMSGATVAITSSSDAKLAACRELGADITVNYRTNPAWHEAVLAATGGRGADIVVETVGLGTLSQSLYRTISGHLLSEARLTRRTGHTGAVTLIQRFGSALNLNVHLHMIFVDGAYRSDGVAPPVFHPVPPPDAAHLQAVVQRIAERVGRMLERRGLIERDAERAWLSGEPGEAGALDDLIGRSITYRIAVGPRAGQKVFTLQSIAAQPERAGRDGAAEAGGFSLHAGLEIQPGERARLERLCRYVSRPPVATERLAVMPSGQVRYQLKTPYRDGTTHIVLEPLDLMARLAALVPPSRMHLTRYHGVFAPHSRLRAAITPSGRGAGGKGAKQGAEAPAAPKRAALSWAQRLKRVFAIEIENCCRCQGRLRVIASIEEPEVIARILAHQERGCGAAEPERAPIAARAPPRQGRLL